MLPYRRPDGGAASPRSGIGCPATGHITFVAEIRVGISGWQYAGWRGDFYPPGLPQRRQLEYVAERMRTVEINGSFYSLQRPASYLSWVRQTPDDFMFAVKGGRFITHMKKLAGVETPLANFLASGVLALGAKLGPLLWQLPPNLGFNPARLSGFFDLLPRTTTAAAQLAQHHDQRLDGRAWTTTDVTLPVRHALEVRHDSFRTQEFVDVARQHDIAIVTADTAGKWPMIDDQTADFAYVRLHGDEELYVSGYTDKALDMWATRILEWHERGRRDVFVYFDNDVKVRAPYDAMALARRVESVVAKQR
jgi:uncharacterized protein YecE (DUF72 family)